MLAERDGDGLRAADGAGLLEQCVDVLVDRVFLEPEPVADLSRDTLRPQLRFTPRLGWLNDPNGLSYYNGEWHAFCQHNTAGTGPSWEAGRTAWYHFVSKDLAHWEALGDAVLPQTELRHCRFLLFFSLLGPFFFL